MAKGPLAKTDNFSRVGAVSDKVHHCLGSLSLKWEHHSFWTHRKVGMQTLWSTHVKASKSSRQRWSKRWEICLFRDNHLQFTHGTFGAGYIVTVQKALGSGCAFPSTAWHLHWQRRSGSPAAAWEATQQHRPIPERGHFAWRGTAQS